ncbi:hypothetical protein Bca4012_014018 [Brassica carinata]
MAGCVNYMSPHVTLSSPRASLSLSFSGDSLFREPAKFLRRSPSITAPRFQVVAAEKAEPPPLKIMISGAPASGKGTQCELITQKYGLVHISAGDLLRAEIVSGSENGRLAKEYMEKGQLVPTEIVAMMVKDRLSQTDSEQNGWLLDGYPRSSSQATALKEFGFHPDLFILLEIKGNRPKEEVFSQIDTALSEMLQQRNTAPSSHLS